MKRTLIIIAATLLTGSLTFAQPAKRRTTSSAASTTTTAKNTEAKQTSDRASLQFPTSAAMPEDVVWKRDIYRQLDLMKDKNAPMYYPVEPIGKQVNLFTYLFRLIQTGRVTAYTYKLDGNESFEEKDKLSIKDMLERYGIYYEEKDGKIVVADADVPSAEATRYYIKESVYLDQRTGTFSTKVTALCPILMRGSDEFSSDATTPYPLFWLKYDDVAPWLAKLPMMGSNLNNVSNMTADDYFTLNRYEGKIYKTNNLQGKVLANYCETDSAMKTEQLKIEKQIVDFEEGVWGHEIIDSTKLDSITLAKMAVAKTEKKSSSIWGKRTKTPTASTTDTKKAKEAAPAAARVSARRQRR
ncbi:MAG: gliding motility protein GldN [Bacteroidaceae bacterium]|jgi:gliding motility associated protien GldN|nr:gliding motility protein GldN [Bacteroidaceae bacterium]MBR6170267.1 gliding motility protein GldN [Bacteroidaceae bacterium]